MKGERIAAAAAKEATRAAAREKNPVRPYFERTCPECGTIFHVRQGPGQHQRFCKPACGQWFKSRCAARGKVVLPLALAWRVGRGKKGTVSADAHAELIAVLDSFAAEDRAAGRPKMDDYVGAMLGSGLRYVDRKRS